MTKQNKLLQLQIRVSTSEKSAIQESAKQANMNVSEWIMAQLLPANLRHFQQLVTQLKHEKDKSYILAELHDLFNSSSINEFTKMVSLRPNVKLTAYWENYLAAMIEYTAYQKGIQPPAWVHEIKPLDKPVFGTNMINLRLYLLTHCPPPFRTRNIFIDSSIGKRV